MSKFKISCSFTHVFFSFQDTSKSKNDDFGAIQRFDLRPHCTPLTRIVPRLLLLYSIPSIHNYRNVVIRTGSWTAAYVCFVYACCLYCCVNLPLVHFCMFASFACFDSVNLEGSCVAFESCNDTDWLLGHRGASLITSKKAVRPGAPWKLPHPPGLRVELIIRHSNCVS